MGSSTQSQTEQLHVFFIPFMSPGHLIPMIDIAKLFTSHGIKATIITTPQNISRFHDTVVHNPLIHLHALDFPYSAVNLPPNCENLDTLPSRYDCHNLSKAIMMLQPQADHLIAKHRPDAVVFDRTIPWSAEVATKYNIPRIVFSGQSCFSICVSESLDKHKPYESVNSDTEPFLVPNLPDKIYLTKSQVSDAFYRNLNLEEFFMKVAEAERNTHSVIVNTFKDLEPEYILHCEELLGKKVWPVGPVSLFNTKKQDIIHRGNKSSITESQCLAWLNTKQPNSVLYVCFGSLCIFSESQMLELALGLEASNCSFIWVIRETQELNNPLLENYEERVAARGLIIKGWAPQLVILNHHAVAACMTHCGWNSILEAVSAEKPLITWPLFAEQFYNERFVVEKLKVGVGVGVEKGLVWGEEESCDVVMKREQVEKAVRRMMSGGEEVDEMRKRVSELGEMGRVAMSESGSSSLSVRSLIEDLWSQKRQRLSREIRVD